MTRSLLVLLVPGLFLVGGSALGAPGQKDVPYTKTPIQVSGAVSQFPATGQLFSVGTAAFYAAWDDQNLYFGVEAQDAALFSTPEPPDSQNAWNNDAVELMFDLKNKKALTAGDQDFRQWIFPLSGQSSLYDAYGCGALGDVAFTGTVTLGLKLNGTLNDASADTGYSLIVAIPWADLATTPADGVSFGFDAAVDDVDAVAGTCTFADWAGLTSFAQPDQWGTLQLTGKGSAPPGKDSSVAPPGRDKGVTPPPGSDAGGWPMADSKSGVKRPTESVGCGLVPGPGAPAPLALGLLLGCVILPIFRRILRRSRGGSRCPLA